MFDRTSINLTRAAFVGWIASLSMPGLALYSNQRMFGYDILLSGWLSPLALNFAWFANVFFLYAIRKLHRGEVPVNSSLLALLLSFDTARFSVMYLDEGGSKTSVYGYGWGAVLWFVSICLLVAAVGSRAAETGRPQTRLKPLGLGLCLFAVITTASLAIYNRAAANRWEAERLTWLAFKRGAVCGENEVIATEPIRDLAGPVEVIAPEPNTLLPYPFSHASTLLDWGIPTVRIDDIDYSYHVSGHTWTLSSVPASEPAAAVLRVTTTGQAIQVTLVETRTNRTVFDQIWRKERTAGYGSYYCPDYRSLPSEQEQPRKLVLQSLGLPLSPLNAKKTENPADPPHAVASIVGREEWSSAQQDDFPIRERIDGSGTYQSPPSQDSHCDPAIGWKDQPNERVSFLRPFAVRERAYYLPPTYRFICENGSVYFYEGTAAGGKYYLKIEKRDLAQFRRHWVVRVVIPDTKLPSGRAVQLQSVERTSNKLFIQLRNNEARETLLLKANVDQ